MGFSELKAPTGSSHSLHAHLTGLIAFYSPLAVEARAENDAADFVWPTEALLSDAALVHSLGSLSNAIIHKQARRIGSMVVWLLPGSLKTQNSPPYWTLLCMVLGWKHH